MATEDSAVESVRLREVTTRVTAWWSSPVPEFVEEPDQRAAVIRDHHVGGRWWTEQRTAGVDKQLEVGGVSAAIRVVPEGATPKGDFHVVAAMPGR